MENRGGFVIEDYEAVIGLKEDGRLKVEEDIQVNFSEPRHGIFRKIPYKYKNDGGFVYNLKLSEFSVLDDRGKSRPFENYTESGNYVLKIGNPDKEISGEQIYSISYEVERGIKYFDEHDELYWNPIGTAWPTSIDNAGASINLPEEAQLGEEDLVCFAGKRGSQESACSIAQIDPQKVTVAAGKTLQAGEGLTFAIKFPKGYLQEPSLLEKIANFLAGNWGFFIPLPVFALMLWLWLGKGREINLGRPVIAQYEPPDELTPGELGYLMREKYSNEFVAADIVNLAVKGYLKIKETEIDGLAANVKMWSKRVFAILGSVMFVVGGVVVLTAFLGENVLSLYSAIVFGISIVVSVAIVFWRNSKRKYSGDYELVKIKDWKKDNSLSKQEKDLLEGIFGKDNQETVKLSELKEFYKSVEKARKSVKKQIEGKGYFYLSAYQKKWHYLIIAGAVLLGGFFTGRLDFIIGLGISAAIIFVFGLFMSKKTGVGAEAFWKARGFKDYIKTAERYRVKFQEKENLFEKFLPYAMVFGLADKWAKAFEDIYEKKPDWYESTGARVFHAGYLASSLNNNFSNATQAASNPPRSSSSSSGFGGGSSSGGGFGGGGGGSW